MTQSITNQGVTNQAPLDVNTVAQQQTQSLKSQGVTVPGANETTTKTVDKLGNAALPSLAPPILTKSGKPITLEGLNLCGVSLETLLDAVGMLQRQTETKVGKQNMAARAEERQKINAEKLEQVKKEVDNARSKGFLDGLLKAFKYIGMAIAAIGAVAMIAVGAVGLAAGGSGAALIAIGVASLYMLTDSIIQEATDGKVGIGPGSIVGKIAEACGASESAVQWIKFGVDLAASIALCVAGGFAAAGAMGGSAANATAKGIEATTKTVQSVAKTVSMASSVANATVTVAKGATTIASAINERDTAFSQAEQRRLQAMLERIALANDLDLDHLKAILQRSEETLQMVSEIVKESVQTNVAILTGSPAMA